MERKKILIVDDEEMSRALLRQMFADEYDIVEAVNGREAIVKISEHMPSIVAVLLDLMMPELNGFQVLQVLSARRIVEKIPVVMITAETDSQTELMCYSQGASAVINKPYSTDRVIAQVHNIIDIHRRADRMEEIAAEYEYQLGQNKRKLEEFYDRLMDVVANLVEFRDLESGEHIMRVKGLTGIMAKTYMELFPQEGLTKSRIEEIVSASALHDIGKIAIPDSILLKPGRLTQSEREVMMSHTTKGCDILNLLNGLQDEQQFKTAYEICRYHHERYDGTGYPDGLMGDAIPLAAQLVSVVDCYDALVSERVYKKAFTHEVACQMIVDGECGIFSPKILQTFTKAREALKLYLDSVEECV